jgi:hypothetical protein
MRRLIFPLSVFVVLFFSCGSSEKSNSRKISYPVIEIKTLKQAFDPASLKISCDSLKFTTVVTGGKIQKLIILNGLAPLDTIMLSSKKLVIDAEKDIIKADYNFDGFCEFFIPDRSLSKNGGLKYYYYVYDSEKQEFYENITLPAFIGEFKLDIKNQRLKLYCPGQECFAYYKYTTDKKFELVQGEFKE